MSEAFKLNLAGYDLNDEDFRQILTKLSNPHRRESHPRKCKRHRCEGRMSELLATLPTNVTELHLEGNRGIGDDGMMHLHLLPDTVIALNLKDCNLGPIGIKRVCEFLKSNKSITLMHMQLNPIGEDESVKNVADMMKVNNTISLLCISSFQISAAVCCQLSEGLALNTGLRDFYIGNWAGWPDIDDDYDGHVQNLCPGLARNKGLESLNLLLFYHDVPMAITEMGVGHLEQALRKNVYLKQVGVTKSGNSTPPNPGTNWNKMEYWLGLNRCNRKLIQDPNATRTQWGDAIIQSSEAGNPDAIFMFLTNKPEWCMMGRYTF